MTDILLVSFDELTTDTLRTTIIDQVYRNTYSTGSIKVNTYVFKSTRFSLASSAISSDSFSIPITKNFDLFRNASNSSQVFPFFGLMPPDYTLMGQDISRYKVSGDMDTHEFGVCPKIYVFDSNHDIIRQITPKQDGTYIFYTNNGTEVYEFCFKPPSYNIIPKWYYNITPVLT